MDAGRAPHRTDDGFGHRPRVVIVGAGFGGIEAAEQLAGQEIHPVIVDRQNYHLFQPLLYQVATAILQPADIAVPIRRMVHRHGPALVLMTEVVDIDAEAQVVYTRDRNLTYDYLILAPGARTSYFGNDHLEEKTFGLKTLDDAQRLRHQILLAFERAEMTDDPGEREQLMTFVVVGGGPNGASTAVAIAELAKRVLAADFERIDAAAARIVLAEAGEQILPGFPDKLVDYARKTLEKKGVNVRTGAAVNDVQDGIVSIGSEHIQAGTVLWTAGVEATQIPRWLDAPCDKTGRVEVTPELTAPGHENIFVIGDAAHVKGKDGGPLPGLAAVAKQQGRYVADAIKARLTDAGRPDPFHYRDYGTMVPLGQGAAIAQTARMNLSGFDAWVVWAGAHLAFHTDFRRRFAVAANWMWAYLTARRGARIIVDRLGTDIALAGRRGETDVEPEEMRSGHGT